MSALDTLVLLTQCTRRGWARRLFLRRKRSMRIPSSTGMRLMQKFSKHFGAPMRTLPNSLSLKQTAVGLRSLSL